VKRDTLKTPTTAFLIFIYHSISSITGLIPFFINQPESLKPNLTSGSSRTNPPILLWPINSQQTLTHSFTHTTRKEKKMHFSYPTILLSIALISQASAFTLCYDGLPEVAKNIMGCKTSRQFGGDYCLSNIAIGRKARRFACAPEAPAQPLAPCLSTTGDLPCTPVEQSLIDREEPQTAAIAWEG
jgi:hypothetical protein